MPRKEHQRNVLFVTSNFPRWKGDSTTPFILHLAQDIQKLGWCVDVLAPHAPGAELQEVIDGIRVFRFRYLWPITSQTVCYQGGALINLRKNKWNLLKLPPLVFFEFINVCKLLSTRRYSVLHSHWILPQGFVGSIASKIYDIPHIITIHGSDAFGLRGVFLGLFKRIAIANAGVLTVNSSATESAIRSLLNNKGMTVRIPMGVSLIKYDPVSIENNRIKYRKGNGPMLVFVGRLVEEKGISDFIRTIASASKDLPDISGLVVGDGQDKAKFQNEAKMHGISDRIHFVGWVPPEEIGNYLASADIFLGPSKKSAEGGVEAQGLSFAEALMAELPVIATRSGGIPDTIQHGETGWLVQEGDVEGMVSIIKEIWLDPKKAKEISKKGKKFAEANLTRNASAAKFIAAYDKLINNK